MPYDFPQYSDAERLADGCIHLLGVIASVVGVTVLLVMTIGALPATSVLSLIVYSFGLLAVFALSAAYNVVSPSPIKAILRRFDQAAIYVKIASTYTPFSLVKIAGWSGPSLLIVVWAMAAFGLTIKLFFPERLMRTAYVLYLAQGWAVLVVLAPLAASVSERTLLLLGAGGLLYTIGVVFHLWRQLRYHNAIWHGFVLCGSSCHYAAIVDSVALA